MTGLTREPVQINQQDNFNANYGIVVRSSALFYFRSGAGYKTTISFMDYWAVKRNLKVAIIVSLRDASGRLVHREHLLFQPGRVIDYAPVAADAPPFEGSVEVEAFCNENLVIPFAAVMAIYESSAGLSMVHAYGRAYSRHEMEEGRFITAGEEGCWTLRDDADTRSFGVFHNGPSATSAQTVALAVINQDGSRRVQSFELPPLAAFKTVLVRPEDHIPGLAGFLNGKAGHASLSFVTGEAFTRMLVGNERRDGRDFQMTHSNFNFRRHVTDALTGRDQTGYLPTPSLGLGPKTVIVYPDATPGEYEVEGPGICKRFMSGEALQLDVNSATLRFRRLDGPFPSRLVTSVTGQPASGILPFECSLGVLTTAQPPKRLSWGVCSARPGHATRLVAYDVPEIFGGAPAGTDIRFTLFSSTNQAALETYVLFDPAILGQGLDLTALFPTAREFLGEDYGFFTAFSDYGGFSYFTLVERLDTGSLTVEHNF